jgi:hypothetical protein
VERHIAFHVTLCSCNASLAARALRFAAGQEPGPGRKDLEAFESEDRRLMLILADELSTALAAVHP